MSAPQTQYTPTQSSSVLGGQIVGRSERQAVAPPAALKLRLDLNLEVEIAIQAKVNGDITLSLLWSRRTVVRSRWDLSFGALVGFMLRLVRTPCTDHILPVVLVLFWDHTMKALQHTHLILTSKTSEACLKSRCEEEKLIVEDVDANTMGKFGVFEVNTDHYYRAQSFSSSMPSLSGNLDRTDVHNAFVLSHWKHCIARVE
ncbi:hypothetical protein EV421DRAFT_2018921 [Armillaria borealis]|uniref:Uncharacterized protein n=1 Tax=Armillaria borealis TaxID=47425 RepID=A0AA39JJ86_9AGAR|nr:hypothetical protein EV421DRAFT_2018921 [Armillaria borealis]